MNHDLRWIAPIPPESDHGVLEAQVLTRQFYQELEHRRAFEKHCQWYHATAERHRQELQTMRRDFNLLGWFYRSWRR
ncbi:hypothetical protein [Leptodesmis sp.]|uniref:hypothetical protein n=1 Tax=Leptodesmis sp. TaxID=3100501 RepID=UPI00405349A1